MRSPLVYFGGKGRLVKKLLPLLPEHKSYVEVFGGAGALLFAKPPAALETYNDVDDRLVNFFRVLRDPRQYKKLLRLAALTPYSREELKAARAACDTEQDPVRAAWMYFTLNRQCFSGTLGSWGFARKETRSGISAAVSRYLSAIDLLPEFYARIMRVQIEHDDWRKILARYDTPNTFFYLDPPYVWSTRRKGKYRHELSDDDHRELVDAVQHLKGKVLLSGYDNAIYKPLTKRWERREFQTFCRVVGHTRATRNTPRAEFRRTEVVWANYQLPKPE